MSSQVLRSLEFAESYACNASFTLYSAVAIVGPDNNSKLPNEQTAILNETLGIFISSGSDGPTFAQTIIRQSQTQVSALGMMVRDVVGSKTVFFRYVGRVIVENQLNCSGGRVGSIKKLQEFDELVTAAPSRLYQDSRKGQVGCGKNGTRGAIFHKRRLLGEYILAVCKAGIWRMSDEMKAHAPKLIIQ